MPNKENKSGFNLSKNKNVHKIALKGKHSTDSIDPLKDTFEK